jgi:GxxExxY protein
MNGSGPQMHTDEQGWNTNRITDRIIGCAMTVLNSLGTGFAEKVCENALAVELRYAGLRVEQQRELAVHYREVLVGSFAVDLLVEDAVIVELKAVKAFDDAHIAQCLNYLRAADRQVCLLLNFGTSRLGIRRLMF